jgi:GT2 family glycosyltransferase
MRDIDDPAKVYPFLNDCPHQDDVSVIIVNYNCRTTLARCLSSILFSSGVSEILLVDNGSTDDSMNLIEGLVSRDMTLKFCQG